MYSREVLSKYIDVALNADAANHVVSELMSELEQIPVAFESDSITTDDLPNYLEDGEIFTENPDYKKQAKDFNIYDSQGKLILTVSPDRSIYGRGRFSFTVPLNCEEDKEAFLDFCDRLQRNSALKYPDDSE
ncbi:MAG: hypothetical protein IJZ79_03480 [Bacilli bacterium]|nr:hypothetical protein [Bacilli bacterium]MBQ8218790.1 hypothetical protein [Bacilli bacterium]